MSYPIVPNFTMYITKRSTLQAKKVKVDFINMRKEMPRMQWQMSKV